jgi:hypothetical protein
MNNPDTITLGIYSEHSESLFCLTSAYWSVCAASGSAVDVFSVAVRPGGTDLERRKITDAARFLKVPVKGVIGLILAIRGRFAFPRFQPEEGLHTFLKGDEEMKCLVHASDKDVPNYQPPPGVQRKGFIANQPSRRIYDLNSGTAKDKETGDQFPFAPSRLDPLHKSIEMRLSEKAMEAVLER